MATDPELAARQKAGTEVERRMVAFLIEFSPVQDLSVRTVADIARFARNFAFEEFSKAATTEAA